MILIRKVQIENFMSISSAEMTFEDDTFTIITGDNGSGKSALFYAIALALFGYRKGDSYKDYVKKGEDCSTIIVQGIFKGYDILYDVTINNIKNTSPLKRVVTYKDETYINSDYDNFMKIHEMEYLSNIMFLFQNSESIIDSRPAERATMLKHLFRFEFNDIVNTLKDQLTVSKDSVIHDEALLNELTLKKLTTTPLFRELPKDTIDSWNNQLKVITDNINELGTFNDNLIKQNEDQIVNINNQILQSNNKINKWKLQIQDATDQKNILMNFLKENNKEDITKSIEEDNKKLLELQKEYDEKKILQQNKLADFKVVTFNINETKKQIEVSKTGICHACGHTIEPSHIIQLNKKLDDLIIQKNILQQQYNDIHCNEINIKINVINKTIATKKQLITTVDINSSKLLNIDQTLCSINDLLLENKEFLTGQEELLTIKLDEKKKLDIIYSHIKERDSLQKEKEDLEEKLRENEATIQRNIERSINNNKITEEINNNNIRIKQLSDNISKITEDINTTKISIDIFENLFPNYIVLQACNQLENYINLFIQKIFPYMKVSLKQDKGGVNFFYTVGDEDSQWLPVKMASGAQKSILSLAYSISLAKLYGLQCIFMDEIDSNCTEDNSKIIYEFIGSLDIFKQIIFISHKQQAIKEITQVAQGDISCYYVDKGEYNQIQI